MVVTGRASPWILSHSHTILYTGVNHALATTSLSGLLEPRIELATLGWIVITRSYFRYLKDTVNQGLNIGCHTPTGISRNHLQLQTLPWPASPPENPLKSRCYADPTPITRIPTDLSRLSTIQHFRCLKGRLALNSVVYNVTVRDKRDERGWPALLSRMSKCTTKEFEAKSKEIYNQGATDVWPTIGFHPA